MTLANIAIYLALIIFIVVRRMIGRPVESPKKLFALPVIVVVLGWGDATKGLDKGTALTLTVAGCAISLAFGLLRGRADRISSRDGAPFVQWTWLSLGLFAANLLAKLVMDVASVAAGETFAEAGHSLILSLGLTLLGEAAVVWYRSGGAAQLGSAAEGQPDLGRSGQPDRSNAGHGGHGDQRIRYHHEHSDQQNRHHRDQRRW
jgi:hypothetical protein